MREDIRLRTSDLDAHMPHYAEAQVTYGKGFQTGFAPVPEDPGTRRYVPSRILSRLRRLAGIPLTNLALLTGWCIRAWLRLAFVALWFGGWGLGVFAAVARLIGYLGPDDESVGFLSDAMILWLSVAGCEIVVASGVLMILLTRPLPCACGR